ncbi:MAG: PKD domain-containing protein [Chryseotalea sp.]|jgi:PKD repeat protein
MSKIYLLILIIVITISSCDNEVIPKSEFELINADLNTPYLTNQFISVLNKSDNGLEYFWDFGNGAYSNDFEPKISYEESGFYTIKLSVKSSTGTISSFEKSIEVKDRVIKAFRIEDIYFDLLNLENLESNDNLKLFVTLNQTKTIEGLIVNNQIYKSNEIKYSEITFPYIISLSEKLILDPTLININGLEIRLEGKIDNNVIILSSNQWSGSSFGIFKSNQYPLAYSTTSFGSSMFVFCNFE